MNKRIKQYILWAAAGALLYFFLNYHIIYGDKSFYLLEKSEKTLEYTFFSLHNKKPEKILKVDDLRHDGIGDLMVELGMISEEDMWNLMERYDVEEE